MPIWVAGLSVPMFPVMAQIREICAPWLAWPAGPVPGVRWWRLPGSQDAIGFQGIGRAGSLLSLDGTPVSCQASDIQISGYVSSGSGGCRRGEQPQTRGGRAADLPGPDVMGSLA